jgi:eukaryotic-like serine/threonine-protein kinase
MAMPPLDPDVLKRMIPGVDHIEPSFAAGGFKAVYRMTVAGQAQALKVVMMKRCGEPELEEANLREQAARVQREIEALGKCKRPEMVKLGTIPPQEFEVESEQYLAYSEEFVAGSNLWMLIRGRPQRPPLPELLDLFAALLNCVEELWSLGYVHRDIKPQNVMKTGDTQRLFVLLDLGIAYAVREVGLTYRPAERMPLATYRYLAPEMMEPDFRDRLDFRTDLYTTGMTVYEYAAGEHPLARDADDLMLTISRALRQPPTPLQQHRPDLPAEFCNLVDSLLKKKPALRPANLGMLRRKVEALR